MDDVGFGRSIRVVRIQRGLRQVDLAAAAHVSRPTIARIERGQIGTLSIDTIRAVAAALEMRVPLARTGEAAS